MAGESTSGWCPQQRCLLGSHVEEEGASRQLFIAEVYDDGNGSLSVQRTTTGPAWRDSS